ncbi:uncharacterized protein LOC121700694 [Alosa sapidissima]|uniref:uncharacterized protein LOC121700694 n=1 Tax=Alosa sapidissima TaxID=34773 RepID=UPI001C0A381A|nr:uncharacterized protein LOC121700694 [Alosa sapidissima]
MRALPRRRCSSPLLVFHCRRHAPRKTHFRDSPLVAVAIRRVTQAAPPVPSGIPPRVTRRLPGGKTEKRLRQDPSGTNQQNEGVGVNATSGIPPVSPLIMPWFLSAPWVPKFAGERQKFGEWQTQTRAMLRAQPLNAQQQVDFVFSTLDGDARREAALLSDADRRNGERVITALEKIFGDTASNAQRRGEFYKCRQAADERTSSFSLRLRECYAKWRAVDGEAHMDEDALLRDQFILGLRAGSVRQELQRLLRRDEQLTFPAAQREARALERELDGPSIETQVHAVRNQGGPSPARSERQSDLEELRESLRTELRSELTAQLKTLSSQIVEELRSQTPYGPTTVTPSATPRVHHAVPMGRAGPPCLPRLWRSRPCSTVLPQTTSTSGFLATPVTGERVTGVNETNDGPSSKPTLIGSQVTLFSESLFKNQLQDSVLNTVDKPGWLTLKAANGLQIPYIGYAILDFKVGGIRIPNKGVIIVNDQCLGSDRAVLGMNVITECWREVMQGIHPGVVAFQATVAPAAGTLWKKAFAVCRQVQQKGPTALGRGVAKLTRQSPVVIPPRTEMILWCQVSDTIPRTNCAVLIEPLTEEEAGWRAAHTLAEVHAGQVPLRFCNPNPFPVEVPQRRSLATVTQILPEDIAGHKDLVLTPGPSGEVEVGVSTILTNPSALPSVLGEQGVELDHEQRQRLHQLLSKWQPIFAQHDEDFGRTDAVKHQIPTGTAPPSRERYRPVPPTLYPELKSLLKNMLEGGVIRESSSPWAAPIVLIKKKCGSWRFCVDFRKLNSVTHKDAYPLPRIEESLTSLKGAQWYSTLDLASGYWQVEVDERDREKTAFTTPLGLFEFERMPFGLCNAPATFQRLMQRCLGEFLNESLLIYLDDVIIYSSSFDQHLQDLDRVFQRLQDHGLKLQPRKCRLFQKRVSYLGHIVSAEGVATDPEKTAVVQAWLAPQNVRQVRSFLGLVGYYRRYIPGFAKIAAPLHGLLHGTTTTFKTAPIQWTAECDRAFRRLKEALVSPPILAYADFTKPFRLYTDASLEGLGAVLAQIQDGTERVIAYASRSLHFRPFQTAVSPLWLPNKAHHGIPSTSCDQASLCTSYVRKEPKEGQIPSELSSAQHHYRLEAPRYRPLVFWRTQLPTGTERTIPDPSTQAEAPRPADMTTSSNQADGLGDHLGTVTPLQQGHQEDSYLPDQAEAQEIRRSQRSTQGTRPLRYQ